MCVDLIRRLILAPKKRDVIVNGMSINVTWYLEEDVHINPSYRMKTYDFRRTELWGWLFDVMWRKSEIENRRVLLFKDYLKLESLILINCIEIRFKAYQLRCNRWICVWIEWIGLFTLQFIVLIVEVGLIWSFCEMCVMTLNQCGLFCSQTCKIILSSLL